MSTEYEAILMYGIPMDSFEDAVDYLFEKGIMDRRESEISHMAEEIRFDKSIPLEYYMDIDDCGFLGIQLHMHNMIDQNYLKEKCGELDTLIGHVAQFKNFVWSY